MENASKALIMAATVLLGVMIISIGVALFNTFSDFSRDTLEKVEDKKIAEWNNNFLKYYGAISTEKDGKKLTQAIPVTAHDIVSVVNLAKQNNENYELTEVSRGDETTYYVQVMLDGKSIEMWTETDKNNFLKTKSIVIEKSDETEEITSKTQYYECIEEPKISNITKRVMCIKFKTIKS